MIYFFFSELSEEHNFLIITITIPKSKKKHIISGYLQIGEIIYAYRDKYQNGMEFHPHLSNLSKNDPNNCIYVARDHLSWNNSIPGVSTFKYDDKLDLTIKIGTNYAMQITKWRFCVPFHDRKIKISFNPKPWPVEYIQLTSRRQEFVFEENEEISDATKYLVSNFGD
jgi:hypothetical protein